MKSPRKSTTKAGLVKDAVVLAQDVRHGRFARTMSAATALGALVVTAEIFLEHDSASFGNRLMWLPIVVNPLAAVAGIAGVFSKTAAHTTLPLVSLVVVANGVQGFFLHTRAVGQKPGGWRNARYNLEMGPPVAAPLMVTLVGGMGLLASVLRRESF